MSQVPLRGSLLEKLLTQSVSRIWWVGGGYWFFRSFMLQTMGSQSFLFPENGWKRVAKMVLCKVPCKVTWVLHSLWASRLDKPRCSGEVNLSPWPAWPGAGVPAQRVRLAATDNPEAVRGRSCQLTEAWWLTGKEWFIPTAKENSPLCAFLSPCAIPLIHLSVLLVLLCVLPSHPVSFSFLPYYFLLPWQGFCASHLRCRLPWWTAPLG